MKSIATHPVIATLADLVRIDSVNPNYEGGVAEAEVAEYVERFFARHSIPTWRQDVLPGRFNVIAKIPGRDPGRRVILEAHMDTVSTAGMTIDPWSAEIRDGRLYGRGACDTKGGLAAMMHAAASLVADSHEPPCEVLFAATIDEEFSYRGVARFCLSELAEVPADSGDRRLRADAAIVAEPTELRLVSASKGLVRFVIETRGKAAHSAKPHLGLNAIEAMAEVIAAIKTDTAERSEQRHPLLGPPTCNIGLIRGGQQINIVPELCRIEIDRRMLPGETTEGVLADYQRILDRLSAADRTFNAVMLPPLLTDLPLETDIRSDAVQTMSQVLADAASDGAPIGVPFCSDASKFGALGIPSMILGPGNIDQAHAAVEYVDCQQVIAATEFYRQFLVRFDPR